HAGDVPKRQKLTRIKEDVFSQEGTGTMQKCAECQQSFKWSQLFQSLWLSFRPVACDTCGTQHKIANASRLLAVLLLLVPVIVIFIFMQNEALSVISLPIVIVIASISL